LKTLAKLALIIALLTVISSLIFLQIEISNLQSSTQPKKPQLTPIPKINPTPSQSTPTSTISSTPSPTPNESPASVTADISYIPVSVAPNGEGGQYLVINGTVTNNSPNIANDVGLHVFAIGRNGRLLNSPSTTYNVIDFTIPLKSGIYDAANPPTESFPSLAPYQTTNINITIYPLVPSFEPIIENVTTTVVWSNSS
jgi:hypothetical protein